MLKNKTIVITGACGLIGKEFVKACLQQNANVVLADINEEAANLFLNEIKNPNSFFVETDITSEESVRNLIFQSKNRFGKIDSLVNNAYPRNKNYGKKVEEVSYESFNENVNLHLGGYFLCTKEFAEFFKTQGHGNVVSMGSIYGIMAPRFEIYEGTEMTMPVEYAAIKSAVIHLTKYFAEYYKKINIRFNCISPGGIFNNQSAEFVKKYEAFAPMLKQTGLNETLVHLLSDESRGVSGENFVVDGGWSRK